MQLLSIIIAVWRCHEEEFDLFLWWIKPAANYQAVTITFFWCKFGIENSCGALSWSKHWADRYRLSYIINFSSHVTIRSKNGSFLLRKMIFFIIQFVPHLFWNFSDFPVSRKWLDTVLPDLPNSEQLQADPLQLQRSVTCVLFAKYAVELSSSFRCFSSYFKFI